MISAISGLSFLIEVPKETPLEEVDYISWRESRIYFLIGFGVVLFMLISLLGFLMVMANKPELLKTNFRFVFFFPSISAGLAYFCSKSFFTLEPGVQALVIKDSKVRVIRESSKHWRPPFFEKVIKIEVRDDSVSASLTPLSLSEYSRDDVLTVTGVIFNPALFKLSCKDPSTYLRVQVEFALDLYRDAFLKLNQDDVEQTKDAQLELESDLNSRLSRIGFQAKEYRGRVQLYAFRGKMNL